MCQDLLACRDIMNEILSPGVSDGRSWKRCQITLGILPLPIAMPSFRQQEEM